MTTLTRLIRRHYIPKGNSWADAWPRHLEMFDQRAEPLITNDKSLPRLDWLHLRRKAHGQQTTLTVANSADLTPAR